MSNPINHPGGRHFDGPDLQPQLGTPKQICSVCGCERLPLTRKLMSFGACSNLDCREPLKDYEAEKPAAPCQHPFSQGRLNCAFCGESLPVAGEAQGEAAPQYTFGKDVAAVGHDRTGYWCARCGSVQTPCEHFPSEWRARVDAGAHPDPEPDAATIESAYVAWEESVGWEARSIKEIFAAGWRAAHPESRGATLIAEPEKSKPTTFVCDCGRKLLVDGQVIGKELGAAPPSSPGAPQTCITCLLEIGKISWGQFAGMWVHTTTLHPKCPTAGNLSKRTETVAAPGAPEEQKK